MSRAVGVAAGGAALALAGLAFGVQALSVPGLGLVLLGAGSWAWVTLAARGATVARALSGDRVEEEDPFAVRIAFRAGLVPAPSAELVDPLLGRAVPLARRGGRLRLDVRFARRGRRLLAPPRVAIRDPLSLAVRVVAGEEAPLLVLPRVEPLDALEKGRAAAALTAPASGLRGSPAEVELDSLRPYREGTPASRIHWPTVARTGEMVERHLVPTGGDRPVIVLDSRRPVDGDALDRAVRATASLLVHLAREGDCAVLLPGDRRPRELARGLGGWPGVHAALAAVGAEGEAPFLGHLGRRPAIWVTAAGGAEGTATARAAVGAGILVAPAPLEGLRVLFSVAGCAAHALEGSSVRRAA